MLHFDSVAKHLRLLPIITTAVLLGCAVEESTPPRSAFSVEFDTLAVIGAMEGEPWEIFGMIIAAEISDSSLIAVLDLQAPAVYVYNLAGEFVGAVSSAGEGPGELRQAQTMTWLSGDRLAVLDGGNGRISHYHVGSGGVEFVRSQPSIPARSLCEVGGRFFIGDAREGQLIHEIGADGSPVRSFAEHPPLETGNSLAGFEVLATRQLMSGKLLCEGEGGGTVLHISTSHPEMRLYTVSGNEVWRTDLADVYPMEVVVEGTAFRTLVNEVTGSHFAVSVLRWDSLHVLVQHGHRRPVVESGQERLPVIESRLVRRETGEEVARSFDVPSLVAAKGDHFIHLRNEPFPQVLVLKRR